MNIMRNVTEGISVSELAISTAWRQTGKSLYYSSNLCKEIGLPLNIPQKPKYEFSRAKWYEAKLPKDGQGAHNWCIENFGPEPKYPDAWSRWTNRWTNNYNSTFRFRDQKDYNWFILRWGA